MKALTVRDIATGKIVCMGPENGQYDPGHNPATQTKQVEDEYDTLIAQHLAELAALPKPLTMEQELAILKTKVAALEGK